MYCVYNLPKGEAIHTICFFILIKVIDFSNSYDFLRKKLKSKIIEKSKNFKNRKKSKSQKIERSKKSKSINTKLTFDSCSRGNIGFRLFGFLINYFFKFKSRKLIMTLEHWSNVDLYILGIQSWYIIDIHS